MAKPKLTMMDRAIAVFSPERAAKRAYYRFAADRMQALTGGYYEGNRNRRSLSGWATKAFDANAAIRDSQDSLRNDSNSLYINNPIAYSAVETPITNVIGTGLRLNATVDYEYLGISEEQASALEEQIEREWALFSKTADITRTQTFEQLQEQALRSVILNGDVLVNLPMRSRNGVTYRTSVEMVEGHRVSNPDGKADTDRMLMGVELDSNGAPRKVHVESYHPGAASITKTIERTWKPIKLYDSAGLPLAILLYKPTRVGQVRGAPWLAPIIEPLRNIDRYTEAELQAAVISAFFTVFVTQEMPEGLDPWTYLSDSTGGGSSDADLKLQPGLIADLAPGEKIQIADPSRPNQDYGGFVDAIMGQIAMGLNIPKEVLIKAFDSSYSASRGAIIEAWKTFMVHREFMAQRFCQPIYESFLAEAVATGRIAANGFFTDPLTRQAYCRAEWNGPAQGELDPKKEAEAATARINNGTSNEYIETARLGRQFDVVHKGRVKAHKMRDEDGVLPFGPMDLNNNGFSEDNSDDEQD